jgi:periplasmic divalent cation tolerance protein
MTDEVIQVLTTTADKHDAQVLAQALLNKRLAACVQISGPIESSYWWNGRIETGTEWTCLVKTLRSLYREVETTLLDMHPYDQPEILAVKVSDVSEGYATWLRQQVQTEPAPDNVEAPTQATEHQPAQAAEQAPAASEPAPSQPSEVPPAADVTPAEAAEMIPAAGLAAASQSNVPQAMPFAAGNVEAPGAITEQLAANPEASAAQPQSQPEAETPAGKAPAAKPKRAPRKKSPKPST